MSQPARRRVVAEKSASVLESRLRGFRGDLTIADASARGGLALRDAESALYHLSSEYRGHLKATSSGELVFSFPRGLKKPLNETFLARAGRAITRVAAGVGRFIVRAWVSVVLVGYALVLLGVLLAMALKDDRDGIGDSFVLVLRIVAEALFWTFHPFSPMRFEAEPAWARARVRGRAAKVPFYEKVNRFVFGPPPPKPNPRARERQLIAEIRRLEGRVGPGDVMRVTGGSREEAEAILCRLLIDYEGELAVSEDGAVVYKFPELLRTVDDVGERASAPSPIWQHREQLPPLTGNEPGTNLFLGAINGFNLAASGYALANGLNIDRLQQILTERPGDIPAEPIPGTAVALGLVPFVFSAVLFVLPTARLIRRGSKARAVAAENGRRGLLKRLVSGATPAVVPAEELHRAWEAAGGHKLTESAMTKEVRRLGGEPDVDENGGGKLIYRFNDLTLESQTLAAERAGASRAERSVGEVVFSSDEEN